MDKRGSETARLIEVLNLTLETPPDLPTHAYKGSNGTEMISTIDLTLSNVPDLIKHLSMLNPEIHTGWDHRPISFEIESKKKHKKINPNDHPFNFKIADWEQINHTLAEKISALERLPCSHPRDVENLALQLTDSITNACSEHTPRIQPRSKRRHAIWWGETCRLAKKEKNAMDRNIDKLLNITHDTDEKSKLLAQRKREFRRYARSLRKEKQAYLDLWEKC